MQRIVRPVTLVLLVALSLVAAGCGAKANSSSTGTKTVGGVVQGDREVLSSHTASIDGWRSNGWAKLDGEPDGWPAGVTPPLATTHLTLTEQQDSGGRVLILTGSDPDSMDAVTKELRDQFAQWDTGDAAIADEVIGSWKRDGTRVNATVREDGDATSWGLIVRPGTAD